MKMRMKMKVKTRSLNLKGVILVIAVALLAFQPVMGATLNAKVYPTTKMAHVVYSQVRVYNLSYPADSALSDYFSGKTGSEVVTSEATASNGRGEGWGPLLAAIRQQDPNASLINYTLNYAFSYKGTSTTFVVVQNATIDLWLSNVTSVNSSKLVINARWRAFKLVGPWYVNWKGEKIDVNNGTWEAMPMLGNLGDLIGTKATWLGGGGGLHLWQPQPLFDFAVFSQPLNKWHRAYDALTGITTFSERLPANYSLLFLLSVNGKTYSLSAKEDPSATIEVVGYAVPEGDYMVITAAPLTVYAPYALAGAAIAIVVGVAAYASIRWARRKKRSGNEGASAVGPRGAAPAPRRSWGEAKPRANQGVLASWSSAAASGRRTAPAMGFCFCAAYRRMLVTAASPAFYIAGLPSGCQGSGVE